MMAGFVVLVHVPRVLAHPDSRMEWTMLLVAVTLSGSAALVAAISDRRGTRDGQEPSRARNAAARILARP
jgi:hypothetical protein